MSQITRICPVCLNLNPGLSPGLVTRVTRRVPLEGRNSYPSGALECTPLVFFVVFCRSLFVFLYSFFWPWYCRSSFEICLFITLWYLQTFFIPDKVGKLDKISFDNSSISDPQLRYLQHFKSYLKIT